jgi:dihydrodipicolinate synthase/N-acetylneuraminate lyase
MPGFADYCAPAMLTGQHGMITGTCVCPSRTLESSPSAPSLTCAPHPAFCSGNVIPKTMVKLYDLTTKAIESGSKADWDAALAVQDVVAEADWVMVKAGIAGTKYALDTYCSESGPKLGGLVRSPLPQISDASRKIVDEGMVEALKYEAGL